jgi:D-amino-acid dehydrogenase
MSKHVVVIGGGVIGLSAAEACAARGDRVTLIERLPRRRTGCSFGNAGMVVPSHFVPLAAPGMIALGLKWMWNPESPFYVKPRINLDLILWGLNFMRSATKEHVAACAPLLRDLSFASRELYLERAKSEDFSLVTKGLLMLCKEAHTLDEEAAMAARARDLGVPAEVLDAKATAAIDPAISMAVAGAVHYPKDCHLSPERYIELLEKRLLDAGATLHWGTNINGWGRDGARIRSVKTDAGEIEADEFVLCGGIWSDEIVKPLGLRVPMQAGKGYSVTVNKPVELAELCSILTEARVAVTPMDGGMRFGGTMEISGNNDRVAQRRVNGIIRAATSYFPSFKREDFEGIEAWHGLRPCSPDGMPYLGRTAAAANLTVATGHAMMGLSLAPVTGEIVARLVAGEPSGFDLQLLSPDRFASRKLRNG